jgi:hypothetical protein
MPLPPDRAWFRAKTYGYGWGLPCRWQGWVVFSGYLVGLLAGTLLLSPRAPAVLLGWVFALTALLVGLCYWKGETPRWRWGADDR